MGQKNEDASRLRKNRRCTRGLVLGDDFVRIDFVDGAAKRFCSRDRKSHAPKIYFRGEKFDANVSLAVPLALDGSHARFGLAGAVFIDDDHDLSNNQRVLRFNLRAVLTNRVGPRVNAKFCAVLVLTVNGKRNGQRDSLGTAAFLTAKM